MQADVLRATDQRVDLTLHASSRGQLRGVKQDVLRVVALLGTRKRLPSGYIKRTCDNKAVKRMSALGIQPAMIERSNGVSLVVREYDGTTKVITVLPRFAGVRRSTTWKALSR